MSTAMCNTRIEYLYRDASNFKFRGEFVVSGALTKEDVEPFLFDGFWFVPIKVGLSHLLSMPLNGDDHLLHEFEEFAPTSDNQSVGTADEFVGRLATAARAGWFSGLI